MVLEFAQRIEQLQVLFQTEADHLLFCQFNGNLMYLFLFSRCVNRYHRSVFIARSLNKCAKKIRVQRAFPCPLQNVSQAVPTHRVFLLPPCCPAGPHGWAGQGEPGSPPSPAESQQKKNPFFRGGKSCCGASQLCYQLSPSNPWHFAQGAPSQELCFWQSKRKQWAGEPHELGHHLQIMSSISQSGAYLVGRLEDFNEIRAAKFCCGLS